MFDCEMLQQSNSDAAESTLQCATITRQLTAERDSADRIVNFLQQCSGIQQAVLFALDDGLYQDISGVAASQQPSASRSACAEARSFVMTVSA